MQLTLCNEVIRELDFAAQCRLAADLGYDGLEVAPFTLSSDPCRIPVAQRHRYREMARDAGLRITGLHWLMNVPEGLSLTSGDRAVQAKTRDHMLGMVDLCHDLGGEVLVHGSPGQRQVADAGSRAAARAHALEHLRAAGQAASACGLVYCLEPLAPALTDFVNTVDEALDLVLEAQTPGLATMLDTSAAWGGERDLPAVVLARHLPGGHLRHVHFNESNRRAPGQGEHSFLPIVQTLRSNDYNGLIGIEPFDYHPDGPTAAALAIGYLEGLFEACHELG